MKNEIKIAKELVRIAKNLIGFEIVNNDDDDYDDYWGRPDLEIKFYRIDKIIVNEDEIDNLRTMFEYHRPLNQIYKRENSPYFVEKTTDDQYKFLYNNDIYEYVSYLIKNKEEFRYLDDYIIYKYNNDIYVICDEDDCRPYFEINMHHI